MHLFFVKITRLSVFIPAVILFLILWISMEMVLEEVQTYSNLELLDVKRIYTADYVIGYSIH